MDPLSYVKFDHMEGLDEKLARPAGTNAITASGISWRDLSHHRCIPHASLTIAPVGILTHLSPNTCHPVLSLTSTLGPAVPLPRGPS